MYWLGLKICAIGDIAGEGIYQIIEVHNSSSREGGFGTLNSYINIYFYDISTRKFLGKNGGKL